MFADFSMFGSAGMNPFGQDVSLLQIEREYLYFALSCTKQRVENVHKASRTDGYLGHRRNTISLHYSWLIHEDPVMG